MLLFDLINSIPPRIYNFLLAVLMCFGVVYFYLHAGDIAEEYAAGKSDIEFYVVTSGVVVFFFLSRFQSIFGQFLKALAYVVSGAFVIYVTKDLQNETGVLIIRGIVGLTVAFGLYAFASRAFLQSKEEDLKKNGWKLDTKYLKTDLVSAEDSSWYVIETVGRDPSGGEELFFTSDMIASNPADKIVENEIFTVYVDKKNSKRYFFDEESLKHLRSGF